MCVPSCRPPATAPTVVVGLLPIIAAVFISFPVIGLALPVLPLQVYQGLGLDTFVVGLIPGGRFAASLVSPLWSGRHADRRGANHAVVTGLLVAIATGVLYFLSLCVVDRCLDAFARGYPAKAEGVDPNDIPLRPTCPGR